MNTKTIQREFLVLLLLCLTVFPATAQDISRNALTPECHFGGYFSADTNHPTFTGGVGFKAQLGNFDDLINLSLGLGYRGFFDRHPPVSFLVHPTFSDYLFYDKGEHSNDVRPMGGQLVVPAELMLNLVRVDDDIYLFLGIGVEYGLRLYQSHRYGDHYGAHVMTSNSLAFHPMVGIQSTLDDALISFSLYWRHYTKRPLNGEVIDIDKFTARNFFGLQIGVTI